MFKTIPIRLEAAVDLGVRSGQKFTTPQGFSAIKNGVKAGPGARPPRAPKPGWTGAAMPGGARFDALRALVDRHGLSTVCKEARCPNIGECWNAGTATLMLLGSVCTRACRFCAVDTGNPRGWIDPEEPAKVARTVAILGLNYVVLTSVNRDDLADGGASHFAATVAAIREANPGTHVEALTPDFGGRLDDVDQILQSDIRVFAQNIETVRRLTASVRDPRAGYEQTLAVLRHASTAAPGVRVKSSLMLGLGERDDEIAQTLADLHAAGTRIVTIGQYLQPTHHHLPVQHWVRPEQFDSWRLHALELGFHACMAGPLVRSSYHAHTALACS